MRIKPLLAVAAGAMSMLAGPVVAVAVADGSTVGGAVHGGIDAQPVITPLSACVTNLRWVNGRGIAGGHSVGTCAHPASWVAARGPAGGHYSWPAGSCVGWVAPHGMKGGHYIATCGPSPRWVAATGPAGGHYSTAAGASAIHPSAPIATGAQASDASQRFDWGSAGIGAAVVVGAMAIGMLALLEVRRRRIARPPTAITQ